MRGILFILILCGTTIHANVKDLRFERVDLRNYFLKAQTQKETRDFMIENLEKIKAKTPVQESYLGIAYALRTSEVEGNFAKIKLVLKARKHLNSGVERTPKDPECRFLRLSLEHALPSFLGMSKHIEEDLEVIFKNPTFIDDNPVLKKEILNFIKSTNRCSPSQTILLDKQIAQLNSK
jgi:hypothetical protein